MCAFFGKSEAAIVTAALTWVSGHAFAPMVT